MSRTTAAIETASAASPGVPTSSAISVRIKALPSMASNAAPGTAAMQGKTAGPLAVEDRRQIRLVFEVDAASRAKAEAALHSCAWIKPGTIGSVSPGATKVTTVRLCELSDDTSSSATPSTAAMASVIFLTTSGRRPSEKFGTHSIRRMGLQSSLNPVVADSVVVDAPPLGQLDLYDQIESVAIEALVISSQSAYCTIVQ